MILKIKKEVNPNPKEQIQKNVIAAVDRNDIVIFLFFKKKIRSVPYSYPTFCILQGYKGTKYTNEIYHEYLERCREFYNYNYKKAWQTFLDKAKNCELIEGGIEEGDFVIDLDKYLDK